MIGSCDNCDQQNVPVFSGQFCGCDTTQCFICQGDTDPDPYGELEDAISEAMKEPEMTAELQIERRVNCLVSELDELTAMAANSETADLIENEILAFGQIRTRVNLILDFLTARKTPKFRMISNA